jgi:hypothetical protein
VLSQFASLPTIVQTNLTNGRKEGQKDESMKNEDCSWDVIEKKGWQFDKMSYTLRSYRK